MKSLTLWYSSPLLEVLRVTCLWGFVTAFSDDMSYYCSQQYLRLHLKWRHFLFMSPLTHSIQHSFHLHSILPEQTLVPPKYRWAGTTRKRKVPAWDTSGNNLIDFLSSWPQRLSEAWVEALGSHMFSESFCMCFWSYSFCQFSNMSLAQKITKNISLLSWGQPFKKQMPNFKFTLQYTDVFFLNTNPFNKYFSRRMWWWG